MKQLQAPELIALDLDGTLEDSRDDMVAAVNATRCQLGLQEHEPAPLRDHVNRGMAHLYQHCFGDWLQRGGDLAALQTRYTREYADRIVDTTRLYDGMTEALDELRARCPLALVTNKPEALSRLLLERLGVADLFGVIVGGDTCAEAKPTAVPLQFAMESMSAAAERTAMIGDSPGDIACARAAGTKVIWCAFGYKSAPGAAAPDAIAQKPSELATKVDDLFAKAAQR